MINNLASASVCIGLFIVSRGIASPMENRRSGNGNVHLGIILSPLMNEKIIREIGIYWNVAEIHDGDTLILYDGEPGANETEAIYTHEPKSANGFFKTGIQGEFVPTSALTFQDRCLKYHVAWIRNSIRLRTTCLATHPNWMNERKSILGSKRLNEIFIPGTHDSGAYLKNEKTTLENLVDKYIVTQDEDVLGQLIYGVRYLDIRIGRYQGIEHLWWINHGFFSMHPLKIIIDDVKTFLDNTQEIVIFDVQEFPIGFAGNASKAHSDLVAYLEEQFLGYYLPKNNTSGWGISLDDIWATGKRLIIGYDNDDIWPLHESTWAPVNHRWPNVKTLDDLYTKIDRFESGKDRLKKIGQEDRPPSSVMAQLTPDAFDVLLDLLDGLRKMAELVNINVTQSYNNAWKCTANIVSMDFIKSSGIIETALKANDEKSSTC